MTIQTAMATRQERPGAALGDRPIVAASATYPGLDCDQSGTFERGSSADDDTAIGAGNTVGREGSPLPAARHPYTAQPSSEGSPGRARP